MTETTITVRGTARAEHVADRAVVRFAVAATGSERATTLRSARDSLARIVAELAQRQHDGALSAWSADDLRVHAEREWVGDDRPPALRHRAAVSGTATVAQLNALPDLLDLFAGDELVRVDAVQWSLTDERRDAALAAVRHDAVRDAVEKATAFARSLGRTSVEVVALADPGMLVAGDGTPTPRLERAMLASASAGDGAFALAPEPVVIEVGVEARLLAR